MTVDRDFIRMCLLVLVKLLCQTLLSIRRQDIRIKTVSSTRNQRPVVREGFNVANWIYEKIAEHVPQKRQVEASRYEGHERSKIVSQISKARPYGWAKQGENMSFHGEKLYSVTTLSPTSCPFLFMARCHI